MGIVRRIRVGRLPAGRHGRAPAPDPRRARRAADGRGDPGPGGGRPVRHRGARRAPTAKPGCSSSSTARGPSRRRPAASCRPACRTLVQRRAAHLREDTKERPGGRGDPRPQLPGGRRVRDPGPAGPDRLHGGRGRRAARAGRRRRPARGRRATSSGADYRVQPRTGPRLRRKLAGPEPAPRDPRGDRRPADRRAITSTRTRCRPSPATPSPPATKSARRGIAIEASQAALDDERARGSAAHDRRRAGRGLGDPARASRCCGSATTRYDMLRRVDDRLEGLTELAALADAARDQALDGRGDAPARGRPSRATTARARGRPRPPGASARRRSAATSARSSRRAWSWARTCCAPRSARATRRRRSSPTSTAAEEAYEAARAIAERLGDRHRSPAADRASSGSSSTARVRAWFIDRFRAGEHIEILRHVASGGRLEDVDPATCRSIADASDALGPVPAGAGARTRSWATGAARCPRSSPWPTCSWGPDVHVGANPARRIEEIRRLCRRACSRSASESERDAAEAQMLYGVHVFCRRQGHPRPCHRAGPRGRTRAPVPWATVRSSSWPPTAPPRAYLDLGDLARGRTPGSTGRRGRARRSPTPTRARQVEVVRGAARRRVAATPPAMRRHFEQALDATAGQDRRAARLRDPRHVLPSRASASADAAQDDATATALRAEAEARADGGAAARGRTAGPAAMALQAQACLAVVALERGDRDSALALARSALAARHEAMREDPHLEILLPAARVILRPSEASRSRGGAG